MEYTFVLVEGSDNWKILATKEDELPTGEMADTLLTNMKLLAMKNVPTDKTDPLYEMKFQQALLRVDLINKMGGIPYNIDGAPIAINENGGYCPIDLDKVVARKVGKSFPIG